MKNNVLFKGVLPALISPVDDNGKVIKEAVFKLVRNDISHGVNGFYVCGSTGEGIAMSEDERKKMLEYTIEAADGKVPVIAHVGALDFRSAEALAKHANKAGAAAVSSIPPIYFKYDEEEYVDYYKRLAEAAEIPVLLYAVVAAGNMPSVDLIKRELEIPGVIGLKWTYMNYYILQQLKQLNNGNVNVINGFDECLICGLSMGADAGIGSTYNVMPGIYAKLFKAFKAGDIKEAQRLQFAANKVITILLKHNCVPAIKALLGRMGYDVGNCLYPMKRLSEDETDAMIKELTGIVDFETQTVL